MPQDSNHDAYPRPPQLTPIVDKQTAVPNLGLVVEKVFHYTVDVPVTAFRGVLDTIQEKNRPVYYHKKYRRVPDLTECEEGDYTCYYEAEMQWKRDYKVDQEIMKVLQERIKACQVREGHSATQNCAKETELLTKTAANYRSRYEDLGAYGSARKCLMKQKERMMAAEAQTS
ncbi:NADH dehydrogenase 1 beta subcomplex subunit 10 [Labrus bergylta] [Xyrichtys novacula]|uniref:NADH dehydrogenase [ubiquinone] 1 beta subcomplex subunit 10 n=1 Tax=Xyrichtys novacula TaxID=13765 RepID=A0AAV1GVT3_XYRNO|nr:NADH dehydrogenase 1 beta subcomplex subunit 10 [Labrus bergylta] [Xyrichtys novacula]